jgi:predicted RNA-binding protein with PIN domain
VRAQKVTAERARYLIVDGHSVIFAWPELRKLHQRRSSLAREALAKRLRDYQDWSGVRVVVVFDGKGKAVTAISDPHDIEIFYSRKGQTADAIVERLASKYAPRFDLIIATSDYLEQQTASACGADCISPEILRAILEETARARSGLKADQAAPNKAGCDLF